MSPQVRQLRHRCKDDGRENVKARAAMIRAGARTEARWLAAVVGLACSGLLACAQPGDGDMGTGGTTGAAGTGAGGTTGAAGTGAGGTTATAGTTGAAGTTG